MEMPWWIADFFPRAVPTRHIRRTSSSDVLVTTPRAWNVYASKSCPGEKKCDKPHG